MALGTQFSIGRNPAVGRHQQRGGSAISLKSPAVLGRFVRDRLFWPDNGRFGRVSALLH
jgi:hypothetical protein